ncbi:MAG: tetratricopeptide repeat protein [Coleofasciculus sp. B1-GNL1-01]|uniref:tetratricopeptide repeat protein n=1 Tax=Coleofasciculus sp. B1-GNL1-01 TaxID=3068484 RepID=UPI0032FFB59B
MLNRDTRPTLLFMVELSLDQRSGSNSPVKKGAKSYGISFLPSCLLPSASCLLALATLSLSIPTIALSQSPPPSPIPHPPSLIANEADDLAEAERLKQQVEQLYHQGQYSEAIPLAERMLTLYQNLYGEEHPDIADSLTYLGILYRSQGRYSEAEPLFRQVLVMIKRLYGEEHPDIATSLNNLALLYQNQGRYSEAEPLFRQALAMRKRLLGEEHPQIATSLNHLALLYQNQGRYSEAEPLFRQALEMRKRLLGQNHPDVATSLNNLALLYQNQGRYSEAEPLYRQALEMRKRLLGQNHPDVATSLNNLALLYQNQGRYSEAEPLFRQALEMKKRLLGEDHPWVATSLNNLALLYQNQGRYSEAEPLFRQALAMRKRLLGQNHPDVATSLNNLAALYRNQGRYSEAEPLYRQALEMRKRLLGQEHPDVAQSLHNLAVLYDTQGRYSEAESLYRQALEMFKRLLGQDHPDVATSLASLAALYRNQGRYSEAESLYRQALEMFKRLLGQDHPDVATSLNNLALLYRNQGRYTEAEPLFRQSLEIIKRLMGEDHPRVAMSLYNLAVLYSQLGDIDNTLTVLQEGLNIEEYNLTANLAAGSNRQKRDYLQTLSGSTNFAPSFHLNSAPNNPQAANLALTTIFRRKGRILDVSTNTLQRLRQNLTPENQALLAELADTYRQLTNLIYKTSENDITLPPEDYRIQLASLEQQAQQLENQLSRQSEQFRIESQPVTIETIQQLIPEDTVLVELVRYYHQGEPRYAAYILSSQGTPEAIDLGAAAIIDQKVADFRQLFQNGNQIPIPLIKQSARALDTVLMEPVRERMGNNRHILIAPDGTLNLIPFEVLVDENNRYLIETYSFSYLTSGRDLLRLQTSFPSQQPPVLIADPYFQRPGEVIQPRGKAMTPLSEMIPLIDLSQKTFTPLPGTAEEVEAIGQLLEVTPLTGSLATENVVKQVNRPSILHIATHGFLETNPESETVQTLRENYPLLLSGLVLAGFRVGGSGDEDGILTAQEMSLLNLMGTKLVVLSAVDTGLGHIETGEGIYGFRRALVLAGSESQVTSLWKISDAATVDLMVKYYQKLQDNQGRTEALRQSQLEMLNSEAYQHPYYWAAFILSGDWTPMER